MGTVYHKYLGRNEAPPPEAKVRGNGQSAKEKLECEWRRKRIDAESARQRLHEAKLLAMRGELISKKHVTRQAAFLVIALRQRLLALPGEFAEALALESDPRAIENVLGSALRAALDEVASLPERVSDPDWLQAIDGEREAPAPAKRPKRVAK